MPAPDEKPERHGAPVLRDAEEGDLGAVQVIYAHHVLTGLASFEEAPPDRAEIQRRYRAIRAGGWPYLSAKAGLFGVF